MNFQRISSPSEIQMLKIHSLAIEKNEMQKILTIQIQKKKTPMLSMCLYKCSDIICTCIRTHMISYESSVQDALYSTHTVHIHVLEMAQYHFFFSNTDSEHSGVPPLTSPPFKINYIMRNNYKIQIVYSYSVPVSIH